MDEHIRPKLPDVTLDHAKHMRRAPTDAEHTLWQHLRAGRFDGVKFRRQHAIPPYIADFYCHAAKLVIELDGSQHNEVVDAVRTRFLESKGLTVLRFWDNEVLAQTEAVLEAIWNAVGPRPLTPTPLPMGEGP
jgi:very-short-patch-repair endonuclease